jgi:hypothetical protein
MTGRLLGVAVAGSIFWGAAAASSQDRPPQRVGAGVFIAPPMFIPAPTKDGWWVRVNTASTRATWIDWQFGSTPKLLTTTDSWYHSGHFAEKYVEPPLRHDKGIYLRVSTRPADAPASFCVFYQNRGVDLIEFTGMAARQLDMTRVEPKCVP